MMKSNYILLFEDNHLLVVYKKRGVLSQGDSSNELSLLDELKDYLVKKYNKPGAAYLGLVHRLDRNTSGVMVFAKTSKAAKRLSEAIVNKEFNKKYYALVEGRTTSGRLENNLMKDEKNRVAYVAKNGKKAILTYETIKSTKMYSLVDIKLETGRFHQIRIQFSYMGHPLAGDKKYGSNVDLNYYLDCYSLTFPHPITKEEMTFEYKENFNTVINKIRDI